MTERDYLTSLRRHWRLGLSCVILAVLAAVIFTATVTPTYRATATVFVSVRIDEPGSAYQAGMFTQQRVQSYAAIVDSPSGMEVVVDELELELTADELAGRVTAEAPIDTGLLKISAEHPSAVVAREIAHAAAAAFAEQVPVLEQVAGTAE
ncbi:MAG TPA: Wzz/FepE/Etk N-terminal domain-containing protein, partial [Acidimicrobiales bacterium]|nr:Wzz/FepE/Etk N-terminal domain-containing protein [Acidimicrobiales bacterium]